MAEQFGKLIRIDNLREVWPNEATNFTPWLQQNVELLAAAVGVDIQSVEREVAVGDFSVDLVGEEPGSGRLVVIENQLERTDHDHLGKLLTYAAGRNGGVIIWVAPEIRLEHRNALEWLNDATRDNLDFFGVELELLQIEGSPLKAPNFKVVVAPKTVAYPPTPPQDGQVSERDLRYQRFFQDLVEQMKASQPGFAIPRRQVPMRNPHLRFPSGKRGIRIVLNFVSGDRFRVALYIDNEDNEDWESNKKVFDHLSNTKEEIEEGLGAELEWDRMDNYRASRISWYWNQPVTIMASQENLEALRAWAVPSFFKFRDVFQPYIQNIQPDPVGYVLDEPDESFEENE